MKRTQLTVKQGNDAWEISFPETDVEEFTAEENKLLELLSGSMNYVDILKHYSLSTDTIFYHINSMHRKFIVQSGKNTADHFLYTAMLKLTGVTDERADHSQTLVVEKSIPLYQ